MPVSISWHTPYHNILHVQFRGKWTWFDLNRAGQLIREEIKAKPDFVDVIVDMQYAASAPIQNDHHTIRCMLEMMPRNHGVMIFSGVDKFTEMILGIIKNSELIVDRKMLIAPTRQEAVILIAERRDKRVPARSS